MVLDLNILPPTTVAQQKRMTVVNGRPVFFKSKKQNEAQASFYSTLEPYQLPDPITGVVELAVVVTWPWRAGDSKKVRALGWDWHSTKPDLDNWVKDLIDCMVRMRFIEDDAKVARCVSEKRRGDDVGVKIGIARLVR